jgi:hypothetical protein
MDGPRQLYLASLEGLESQEQQATKQIHSNVSLVNKNQNARYHTIASRLILITQNPLKEIRRHETKMPSLHHLGVACQDYLPTKGLEDAARGRRALPKGQEADHQLLIDVERLKTVISTLLE